jgi:hypothetical protein
LLVQQALEEQIYIGWDKSFRGYLSLTWGLLEVQNEVANPYNKTPQLNAWWVISTITKLGTFSKAMWTDRNQKLHDPTNTSSRTSDLDAHIVSYYADAHIANYYANPQDLLAAARQLLHHPISQVLRSRRATKTKWIRSIRRAHRRLLEDRTNRQHTIRHFFDRSVPPSDLIDPHIRAP